MAESKGWRERERERERGRDERRHGAEWRKQVTSVISNGNIKAARGKQAPPACYKENVAAVRALECRLAPVEG